MKASRMPDQFLYEQLDTLSNWNKIDRNIPPSISLNLNSRYNIRPYQIDAFTRFLHCYHNDFPGKSYPLHFLFNMATGSGKTLIMAGLIPYLYEQGYRNFLFYVPSTNIIEKTKDNFLNPSSIKYLFAPEITIDNRRVNITQVENFEAVNPDDINICFTTIQKLHSDVTIEKENALTFEDFRKHKIVLISDEAHHMNVKTLSQKTLFESWENTVERIFNQNEDNLLLEFTATHDYTRPSMVEKYRNKVIIRYDLLQYRNDRYSKDVVIVRSDLEQNERMLQALILSQYKQEVAAKHRINLKPVILFKAHRTIEQSKQVKADFHNLIDTLSPEYIARIRTQSNIPLIQHAFHFFQENNISDTQLAERLQHEFHKDFCLSVNEEKEKEYYQILLNTLEDRDNRIRAIFAVKKLNEGWDVLNLFDIVRCYETRDSGKNVIGSTTQSEAQLIGRGARYFPFVLPQNDDRFRRKFDKDLANELRVLEELHYHSINDSRYIDEIRKALIEKGLMDEREVQCQLNLKEPFKNTDLYRYGIIWFNERRLKDYEPIHSLSDLGVKKRNYIQIIATGRGSADALLSNGKQLKELSNENRRDVNVEDIDRNIIEFALSCNPFFYFNNLKQYFPHITSLLDFITLNEYLGGLSITFLGDVQGLKDDRAVKLAAMQGLLKQIESEIRANTSTYEGTSKFRNGLIRDIFKDKILKFDGNNPLAAEDAQFKQFVSDKEWFAFNTVYGTTEEKAFVRMLDRQIERLQQNYDEIYLLRNEGYFAIYDFDEGRAFQPDFVLFLRERNGELIVYQMFIEPKGKHLKDYDRWKEDFLKQITSKYDGKTIKFRDSHYRLVGVPFYNYENENEFLESFKGIIN